jgi:hypothetical protein
MLENAVRICDATPVSFWTVGLNIVRQRVGVDRRRHVGADMGGKRARRNFARVFVHFLIDRASLRRRQFERRRKSAFP